MKRVTQLKIKDIIKTLLICLLALLIPAVLWIYATQANKSTAIRKEIVADEKEQKKILEENNKLVSEISVLKSPERIEHIATEELGMHKTESDDIIRVEMTGEKK